MKPAIPETPPEYESARITERPDGFYWQARDGSREYGPFPTLRDAMQDMEATAEDEALEPGETLQEAEAEIGISDWIDPDTGEPAEQDGAHLEEH